jgi:hypothetical protein
MRLSNTKTTNNIPLALTILIILPFTYLTCRPGPGFKPATLKEQVDFASTIIEGRVKKVITVVPKNNWTIIMEGFTVLKTGFQGSWTKNLKEVEIAGFKSGSLCGPQPPEEGDQVVVFVCPNTDKDTWQTGHKKWWGERYWKLNSFVFGAGVDYLREGKERLLEIKRLIQFSLPRFRICRSRSSKKPKGKKSGFRTWFDKLKDFYLKEFDKQK